MFHVLERARDRYEADLGPGDLEAIHRRIAGRHPSAVRLDPRDRGAWLYAIRHDRQWLAAVVRRGRVVTLLPRTYLDRHRPTLAGYRRILVRLGFEPPGPPRSPSPESRKHDQIEAMWFARRRSGGDRDA